MMHFLLAAFGTGFSLIILHWLYHLLTRPANLPPGPFPLPIIGTAHWFFIYKKPQQVFRKFYKQYGGVITMTLGHSVHQIVFMDANLIADTFTSRQTSEVVADRPRLPDIGGGVLWATWPDVLQGRKYALRCLNGFGLSASAKKLATNGNHVPDEIANFCSYLNTVSGRPIDISEKIRECLASCVLIPLHGRRLDFNDPRTHELYELGEWFFGSSLGKVTLIQTFPRLMMLFSKRTFIDGVKRMKDIFAEWLEEELPKYEANFDPDLPPTTFIDCYLLAKKKQTDEKMSSESFSQLLADLFLGAMETTSKTTSWILLYLAKYPEWQQQLQEELDSVVRQNEVPTLEHRSKLVKLQAFINEVQRQASFIPFVMSHSTTEEFTVSDRGRTYTIPPSVPIMYTIHLAHDDKSYWGDPEVFRPERWLTEEQPPTLKTHSHYFPFGIGRRVCIGEQAARTIIYLFLTSTLQRFTIKCASNVSVFDDSQRGNRDPPQYDVIVEQRS